MFIQKKGRRIAANEDIQTEDVVMDDVAGEEAEGDVIVEPEATDLLFEAEDVAELIAEVTGETVEVSVTDDAVEFAIGEDVYTVEAEGDEEILEAATKKTLRGKRTVAAATSSRGRAAGRAAGRAVRDVPARGRVR